MSSFLKRLLLSVKYYHWNKRLREKTGIISRDGLLSKYSKSVQYYDKAETITFKKSQIHFHNYSKTDQSLKFVELLSSIPHEIPQPFTITLKNADVIGHMAVAMHDNEIILESTYNSIWYLNKTGDAKFIMNKSKLKIKQFPFNRAISLVSILNTNYFFWLTNFLPLLRPFIDELKSDPNFKILLNPGGPNFQLESLEHLGLAENIYWWTETGAHIRMLEIATFRNAFIPYGNEDSIQLISPSTIFWLRDLFLPSDSNSIETFPNIYISRNKAFGRNILNEEDLDPILEAHNIQKIYLEDYPFLTQVHLLADAKNIITPHGAGVTNVLFSNKAKIFELFPADWTVNRSNIYQLSNLLAHEYHFYLIPIENKDLDMVLDERLLLEIINQIH